MTEWGVVGVLSVLIGLFISVIKPLLTLNTSIVRLTDQMEHVSEDLTDLTDENSKNHKRIHERIDAHGTVIDEHSARLKDHEARLNNIDKYHEMKERFENDQT